VALFEARANLLPATLTWVQKPLSSLHIFEQQSVCLLAEGAIAWFHWNRHKEFFLDSTRACSGPA
jgi:hypothetical protein